MHLTQISFLFCIVAFVFNVCFAEPIPVILKTQTLYDDRDATAVAYFTKAVTAPDIDEASNDDCRIIRIRVEKSSEGSSVDHVAIIQFRPMRTGDIELPALEFKSETESLTTAATQITVSERVKSDRMQLKFTVDTQGDLYVGQAVRIDLEWTSCLLYTSPSPRDY